MGNIINAVSEFMGKIIAVTAISGSILIFAGEVRLAALRKASQGSSKLSTFTMKMTNTNIHSKGRR